LTSGGFSIKNSRFFDTLQISVANNEKIKSIALRKKLNFYYPDQTTVSISVNETTTLNDIELILSVFF
jgi:glycine dehydrogenase